MTSSIGPVSVWLEKANPQSDAFRRDVGFPFGAFLIAPEKSTSGADVYKFMRDVRPGHSVLHLRGTEGIVGTSRVSAPMRTTSISGRTWCLIALENFQKLEPPLTRHALFAPRFAEPLLSLYEQGYRDLFYNRRLMLRQGGYLTPVPLALLDILNDAYRFVASVDLPVHTSIQNAAL